MDSARVLARFEAQRQALALMDHPNIAKVLDAGTTGGGVRGWRLVKEKQAPLPQPLTPNPQSLLPHASLLGGAARALDPNQANSWLVG